MEKSYVAVLALFPPHSLFALFSMSPLTSNLTQKRLRSSLASFAWWLPIEGEMRTDSGPGDREQVLQ